MVAGEHPYWHVRMTQSLAVKSRGEARCANRHLSEACELEAEADRVGHAPHLTINVPIALVKQD